MISYYRFSEYVQNPKVKKRIRWGFHVMYFFVFFFIYVPSFNIQWPLQFPHLLYRDVFEYGLISLFVYFFYFFKGREGFRNRVPLVIGLFTVMLSMLILLAFFKNQARFFGGNSVALVFNEVMQYVGFGGLLFASFVLVDNIEYVFPNKYYKLKKAFEISQNQMLRQQFHPHFLFNALNSAYSMSLCNHPDTPDTILKLSGMMRFLTDELYVSRMPLEREIQFIKDYIDVEKIRFGEKANINLEIEGDAKGKLIEPFLLVPLVENAFKHGYFTNNPKAFVYIKLEIFENWIFFKIQNRIFSNSGERKTVRKGKGLDNLQQRLNLVYPKTSQLFLTQKENVFHASLEIKLEE